MCFEKEHTYYDEGKRCTCDKKGKTICDCHKTPHLQDFKYYVGNPNIYNTGSTSLTIGQETVAAAVTINNLQEKSKVLLQGLLHFTTNNAINANVIVRIRKFTGPIVSLPLGELIYETAPITLANVAFATFHDQVSLLHVDENVRKCEDQVTYVVTVQVNFTQASGAFINLNRPITLTATEIN